MINECWSRYHTVFTINFDRSSSPLLFYCQNAQPIYTHTRLTMCTVFCKMLRNLASHHSSNRHSAEHQDPLNNSVDRGSREFVDYLLVEDKCIMNI